MKNRTALRGFVSFLFITFLSAIVLIMIPSMGRALTVSGNEMENAADGTSARFYETVAGASGVAVIHGQVADGTLAVPVATPTDRTLLTIGGAGYTGSSWTTKGSASILFKSSENWSTTAQGADISFATTPNGSTSVAGRQERMRITNDGKVGIGITAPTENLHVAADGASSVIETMVTTDTTGSSVIRGANAAGTLSSPSNTPSNRSLLVVGGAGYDGSNWTDSRASVRFSSTENWDSSHNGAQITFSTTSNASTKRAVRMTITDDGKVGIGTTTPSESLEVSGAVKATTVAGDGSGLTNIGSSALAAGAVTSAAIAYYSDVAVVAPSGGDYTNPYDAMNDITNWCNPPTGPDASHPCLVKIMPGVYNVGTNSVVMQSYVDIEGSGQRVTYIEGNIDSLSAGVVNGQKRAEMRFLSVRNTGDAGGGTNANAVAICNNYVPPGPPLLLTKVSANASGASGWNIGISNMGGANPRMLLVRSTGSGGSDAVGVHNEGASPSMVHVSALARNGTNNYGVLNYSATPTMEDGVADAAGGSAAYGVYTDTALGIGASLVTIHGSKITGTTATIVTNNSQFPAVTSDTIIGLAKLDGGAVSTDANSSTTCAGVYDETYVFYTNTCP